MDNVMFTGIIPAIVSPVNEDGTVKEQVLRKLINWHLQCGVKGFYLCGGTGEGTVMKPDARKKMAEITVDEVQERGCVISHIGAVDYRTAEDLAKHAADIGVDAISSVLPFFYIYGRQEIIDYYKALSEACSAPLLMYATPLAKNCVTLKLIEELLNIDNIIGLKFTGKDYFEMQKIKIINNGNINVINGFDQTLICGLAMGADGGIGATYNIMPGLFVKLYTSFMKGEISEARAIQYKINKVINIIKKYGVLTGVKDALNMIGYEVGYCTFPIKRFTESQQKEFRSELSSIKFEEEYLET